MLQELSKARGHDRILNGRDNRSSYRYCPSEGPRPHFFSRNLNLESLLLEVLLDDPLRLPLIGLPLEPLEGNILRPRTLNREQLGITKFLLPILHRASETLDLGGVGLVGGEVCRLVRVGLEVE